MNMIFGGTPILGHLHMHVHTCESLSASVGISIRIQQNTQVHADIHMGSMVKS